MIPGRSTAPDGHSTGHDNARIEVRISVVRADERDRARLLLIELVADVCDVAISQVRLDREPSGRLFARGLPVHVSLSHTRGVVAVAVAAPAVGPIGVDIETRRELPAEKLAARWFAPAEAAWVSGLAEPGRPTAFLWLWTQKEALGKALGTGLAGGSVLRQPVRVPDALVFDAPLPNHGQLLTRHAANCEFRLAAVANSAPGVTSDLTGSQANAAPFAVATRMDDVTVLSVAALGSAAVGTGVRVSYRDPA